MWVCEWVSEWVCVCVCVSVSVTQKLTKIKLGNKGSILVHCSRERAHHSGKNMTLHWVTDHISSPYWKEGVQRGERTGSYPRNPQSLSLEDIFPLTRDLIQTAAQMGAAWFKYIHLWKTFLIHTIITSYLHELQTKNGNLSASKHYCGLKLEAPKILKSQ